MPRKLLIISVVTVALQLIQEVFIGVNPLGSLIANSLQIFSAVLAFVMCVRASRRGKGFTRPFWLMVGCSLLAWAIANLGWVYYESYLNRVPPENSIFPFLINTRSLFLAMALLLDQTEDLSKFDFTSFLDFVQLVIIFALIYLGWFYVPSLRESPQIAALRSAQVEIGEDMVVLGLALMQAVRARTARIRSLYLNFILYFALLTVGSIVTDYEQMVREVHTGTWLDLWWTVPHLLVAAWALRWQPGPNFFPTIEVEKSFSGMLLDNTVFALAPLIVLLQAAQLGPGWRQLSFSLLGVSILCFATRLDLSEFREARSAASAHKADRDRLEAETNFRIAFEASPESLTITTLEDGIYVEVNNAFVSAMGYERSELIGKSVLELNVWVDKRDRIPLLDQLRRGERIRDAEVRFRTKSGKERQMLLSADTVQMQGHTYILSILHDVTEQRLLEKQFHQAQKMEAVGRLAGGVAHDFNNLLMITGSSAHLLEESKNEPARVERYARQIQNATDRGASLTRQLLAFSRQQILNPSVLNLNIVITELWKMLPRLLGEDIDTVLSLDAGLGQLSADRGQLEQVIMNLAVNARDAMPGGGKISVETANVVIDENLASTDGVDVPVGSYVLLAVTDTGIGMDPAVRARIFDPFFTTKELGKGTGLGMATVYGIVKQSGGYIRVFSEVGKGSTFKIYFPRIAAKAQHLEASQRDEPVPMGTATILLAEDEAALREVAAEYLRAKGYQVVEAGTAEAALELCKSCQSTIDLLISDIVMPGSDGLSLAREVSTLRPALRMIFMSGYTDRALGPELRSQNVTFFQKPFSLDALARKIHAMLNERSQ